MTATRLTLATLALSGVASVAALAEDAAPDAAALKSVAQEAYVYAFPMLVAYKVLHDYNVDQNSGAYIAPFNQLHNEARVYSPKDTAVSPPTATRPIPSCSSTCAPSRW